MKVLFANRDPKSWIGGDQIQLEKTRTELGKLGVETRFTSLNIPDPEDIVDVDIVHCFNFCAPWTKFQIWQASKLEKKIVCSMIYHETDKLVDYPTQQAMVNECSALIFLTKGEVDRARRHLDIPPEKIWIVPNGIDAQWFEPVHPVPSDVLTVGRIEEGKGQLAVAKACKELGLQYTCIGELSEYAKLVAAQGAKILPAMTQEELRQYYAGCQVFCLASMREVMPLSAMEAGAQAKNIVLTSGCEWRIPAEYVTFDDVESIKSGIQAALERPDNTELQTMLRSMTWENVAKSVREIYDKI